MSCLRLSLLADHKPATDQVIPIENEVSHV